MCLSGSATVTSRSAVPPDHNDEEREAYTRSLFQPENILVRVTLNEDASQPPTLVLKLLDFGLATHYSASEAKLTTCCGSPAYHSPELWRSLREPSGTVKYWVRPPFTAVTLNSESSDEARGNRARKWTFGA